jgi:hypothetical protein
LILAKRPAVTLIAALLATAGLALTAWLAAPAGAVDNVKPEPSCAGVTVTDPAGDAALDLTGAGVGIFPVPDNLDITGGFFRYDPDPEGTPKLTANIKVANLDKSVPDGATGASWYFFWTVADVTYFVNAEIDSAGATTFNFGHIANILETDGQTKGKFFEGPDGIIQIDVPQAGTKASDGATLRSPYASSRASFDLVAVGYVPTADDAPDSQAGKSYTVAQCAAAAPPTTGTTTPTTTTGTAAGTLPVRLSTSTAKASKAKKGKTLSLKLLSSEKVTAIKGKLTPTKNSTSYGTGKLATLDGSGTLKIKLKRAMKKGAYKLALSGKNAAGQSGKGTFRIRVR